MKVVPLDSAQNVLLNFERLYSICARFSHLKVSFDSIKPPNPPSSLVHPSLIYFFSAFFGYASGPTIQEYK
jgi:hypothetical protein